MMELDDFAPTKHERQMLSDAGVLSCQQVAIGYLRAARKDNKGRRIEPDAGDSNLGDLFGSFFNQPNTKGDK
jgi:hypothetical protein